MFGPHLTLDLYGCDRKKLLNKDFVFSVLIELPQLIDMHRISEPQVTIYNGSPGSFDAGGISAFVLIAESHITVHTFAKDGFVSIDIFSCKEFDMEKTLKFITEKFKPEKIEKNFIIRGKTYVKHYPADVRKAERIVHRQRAVIR